MRRTTPWILLGLALVFPAFGEGPRPSAVTELQSSVLSGPNSITVIDLSGAAAHRVIVLVDGLPYSVMATPPYTPTPGPGPTPIPPPNPLPPDPPPVPPDPPVPPVPIPTPTPVPVGTKLFAVYISEYDDMSNLDVRKVATSASLKTLLAPLGAYWFSFDQNDTENVVGKGLAPYVNATGLPSLVIQDEKGNIYDENGLPVPKDSPHAIKGPTTEDGVVAIIKKLRGQP